MPDDDVMREPRELKLEIGLRLANAERRVYIGNSVELARYVYTPGCLGCGAAVSAIPGLSRDHADQGKPRIVTAMSLMLLSAKLSEERMNE